MSHPHTVTSLPGAMTVWHFYDEQPGLVRFWGYPVVGVYLDEEGEPDLLYLHEDGTLAVDSRARLLGDAVSVTIPDWLPVEERQQRLRAGIDRARIAFDCR